MNKLRKWLGYDWYINRLKKKFKDDMNVRRKEKVLIYSLDHSFAGEIPYAIYREAQYLVDLSIWTKVKMVGGYFIAVMHLLKDGFNFSIAVCVVAAIGLFFIDPASITQLLERDVSFESGANGFFKLYSISCIYLFTFSGLIKGNFSYGAKNYRALSLKQILSRHLPTIAALDGFCIQSEVLIGSGGGANICNFVSGANNNGRFQSPSSTRAK